MHCDTFELRLGLVLYGGASLAVYMSGMTQELLALARAGHARRLRQWLEAGAPDRPDWDEAWVRLWVARQEQENPYLALLDDAGIDVVIDVLAGTSAGGLNGLLLAKALACGAPELDGLAGLWRDTAQIADLARHDPAPRSILSGAYLQEQLAAVMRSLSLARRPELAGLCDVLDLFLTATDVRGHAWTRFDRFHQRIDGTSHKYLFRLKKRTPYGHGDRVRGYSRDDFTAEPGRQPLVDRLLAKIGGATAAFPGVFPPVLISPREAREAGVGVLQDLGEASEEGVWFSDGGMLLNAPFEPVLETIVDRRANRPVKRVLAFLEPDPCTGASVDPTEPGMLETVLSAVTLPMQQDVRENLDRLNRENQRRTRLMELMKGLDYGLGQAAPWAGGVISAFAGHKPPGGRAVTRTYYQMRLNRLRQVLRDAMARALAAQGLEPDAVSRGTEWILTALEPPGEIPLVDRPDDLLPFLEVYDLDFQARRVHYLLGRLHDQYRPGVASGRPDEMTRLLDLLWGAAADWRYGLWLVSQVGLPSVTFTLWQGEAGRLAAALAALAGALRDGRTEGGAVAAAVAAALTAFLEAVHATADGEVQEALALADGALEGLACPNPAERLTGERLHLAYLDFASLDVILFPVSVGAGQDGWGEIGLYGLRPSAAAWSGRTGPEKLTGVGLGHFAAFLDPRWRSNDIMWGRLDGAELLVRMLARETGRGDALPPAWQEQLTRRRRQILAAFPDLVDVPKVRALALLDTPVNQAAGTGMPMRERLTRAYSLVVKGEAEPPGAAGDQRPPTLDGVPDAVLREYLANHCKVAHSGLDDLPPRRLAGEILLMLDNAVQALSRTGSPPLVGRLQQGLTVVLRPLNWVARLVLLPRRGLSGLVQENLGPLMTLVGAVLLLGWAFGALDLSPAGKALTAALFLPALLDVLVRPTWLRVLLLGLPALVTGLAAAAERFPWLPAWLAWEPLGRLWSPFAAVFGAAVIAWWTAWRWRGPLRRMRKGSGG